MIFYGRKANKIGEIDIDHTSCTYCNQNDTQRISVFGKYFHLYWIPFFPIGKEVVAECTHCKRTIRENEFSPALKSAYRQYRTSVKRPYWHWTGIGVIAFIVVLSNIINATKEVDPRRELLQGDLKQMTNNPSENIDSTAYKLKAFFNDFANEEIKPEQFEFLTKTNDQKVLILVKIPNLKKVEKSGRKDVIDMIELIADSEESIKDMDKYIGVHGRFNMMMVKTPQRFENDNFVSDDALFDFYGSKPEK